MQVRMDNYTRNGLLSLANLLSGQRGERDAADHNYKAGPDPW